MQRWEYLSIAGNGSWWSDCLGRKGGLPTYESLSYGDPTKLLNDLGEQGWDLAGAGDHQLFLKRPKS